MGSSSHKADRKHTREDLGSENPPSKRNKMKIADEEESTKSLVPVGSGQLPLKNNELVTQAAGLSRPDTRYIFCPQAQQVTVTSGHPSGQPETIALLIPSSVLNATQDNTIDTSLLEVSCSVLNLHIWPMPSGFNTTTNT